MTLNDEKGLIKVATSGAMLQIEIDRPKKLNAINRQMYSDMAAALLHAEQNDTIRVVLVHGSAECFTSGNDLHDFIKDPPTGEASPVFQFLTAISQARKPLVAAVSGLAIGIGTTMLLHCDLVYAGESAQFQLPFVNLGLCPEAASSLLLPQLAGYQRAAELLLLGKPFDAAKANEIGFVNKVFPDNVLLQNARAQAQLLAKQPPAAVRLTKQLMKKNSAAAVSRVISEEGEHFIEQLASSEALEALSAFFEGRKADFS
ncbi:MAG: enoyl-CoA hydratase [Desulfuromonadales bacterium]|nr:enoyl-CoA hydratase [Desulfuromonadales bacterium]